MIIRVVLFLLLLIGLFADSVTRGYASPLPESASIKISIANDLAAYSFVDKSGKLQGLLVDYWQLWAQVNQQTIVFVPASWSESFTALQHHRVDLHAGLFKRGNEQGFIKFLPSIYTTKSYIYLSRNDKNKIENIKDLSNKSLGLITQSFYEEYFKKNFPKINIKRYATIEQLILASDNGDIDAFINESLQTSRYIRRHSRPQLSKLSGFELTNNVHPALASDNPLLQQFLRQSIKNITTKELLALESKWLTSSQINEQPDKKFLNIAKLSAQELKYIADNPTLIVGVEPWAPIIYSEDNETVSGIVGDFIRQISRVSGLKIQIKSASWALVISRF